MFQKLKKWIDSKKADARFKQAGPGISLCLVTNLNGLEALALSHNLS